MEGNIIPQEYICSKCDWIMENPVYVPCCKSNFCLNCKTDFNCCPDSKPFFHLKLNLNTEIGRFKEVFVKGKLVCIICHEIDHHSSKNCPLIECVKCGENGHLAIFCKNSAKMRQKTTILLDLFFIHLGNDKFQLLQISAIFISKEKRLKFTKSVPLSEEAKILNKRSQMIKFNKTQSKNQVSEKAALKSFIEFSANFNEEGEKFIFVSHLASIGYPLIKLLKKHNLLGDFRNKSIQKCAILKSFLKTERQISLLH